jgi:hypothetical protein
LVLRADPSLMPEHTAAFEAEAPLDAMRQKAFIDSEAPNGRLVKLGVNFRIASAIETRGRVTE